MTRAPAKQVSVFLVFLDFSRARARSREFLPGHNDWIAEGIAEGCFLLVGSQSSGDGGALLVHALDRRELEAKLALDPFVENDVVVPRVVEVAISRVHPRLDFLVS